MHYRTSRNPTGGISGGDPRAVAAFRADPNSRGVKRGLTAVLASLLIHAVGILVFEIQQAFAAAPLELKPDLLAAGAPSRGSVAVRLVSDLPAELQRLEQAESTQTAAAASLEARFEAAQGVADDIDEATATQMMQQQAERLNRVVRPESVDAVARTLEQATGVDNPGRAFAPVEGVEGEFRHDTAVLYDIQQVQDADGRTVYRWTLVDADGRSLTNDVTPEHMTVHDMIAFRAFQMSRDNPALRRLMDSVRKIGQKQIDEQRQAEAEAEASSGSPDH